IVLAGQIADSNDGADILGKWGLNRLKTWSAQHSESGWRTSNDFDVFPKEEAAFKATSLYSEEPIGAEGYDRLVKSIEEVTMGSTTYLAFHPLGGKICSPQRCNSYPHRSAFYLVELFTEHLFESKADLYSQNLNRLRESLIGLFSNRCYVNYPDLDLGNDWASIYYGDSLEKLLEAKKKYDPGNHFDFGEQSLSTLVRTENL
ncbi:hypothetical protein GW916_07805, partial [bacterium]|nr:hypothetical protein [bacterium]